jgi:hypothetical protein
MPAVTTALERSVDGEYRFPLTASDYKVPNGEETMLERRSVLYAVALPLLLLSPARAQEPGRKLAPEMGAKKPKYYFTIVEVNIGKSEDKDLAKVAHDLFESELLSRKEFTNDLGGATEPAAELAQLKKRGLKGFRMSLRLDKLSKDLKEPKPGGRLKQLAVDVKLSVFGTTFPGEKLAFSGEGEAVVEAEVVEARLEQEAMSLVKEAMPQAIKQAVDQAVAKLSLPQSAPMNESKHKRKK